MRGGLTFHSIKKWSGKVMDQKAPFVQWLFNPVFGVERIGKWNGKSVNRLLYIRVKLLFIPFQHITLRALSLHTSMCMEGGKNSDLFDPFQYFSLPEHRPRNCLSYERTTHAALL